MVNNKIKAAIKKIIMNDNSISDEDDLQIYWEDTVFENSGYIVYFLIFTGSEWSPPKINTIKLTKVLFFLED
jgi:hypothetical protein